MMRIVVTISKGEYLTCGDEYVTLEMKGDATIIRKIEKMLEALLESTEYQVR